MCTVTLASVLTLFMTAHGSHHWRSTDARRARVGGVSCPLRRYATRHWVREIGSVKHIGIFRHHIERQEGHSFLCTALRPGSIVVDLGLNTGGFAAAMIRNYECRVFGLEPIRDSYERASHVAGLVAECAAVAETDGSIELHVHPKHGATTRLALRSPTNATTVATAVSLPSFLARHGLTGVDLLKMDVEGSEVEVLESVPADLLAGVAQITVEFHDSLDATLKTGVAGVTARLESLGFRAMRFSRNTQDVLFVNARLLPLSTPATAWLLLRYKYLRGLRRVGRRLAA